MTISHVWPGYTLLNVWDLPYKAWILLRSAAEQWERTVKNG